MIRVRIDKEGFSFKFAGKHYESPCNIECNLKQLPKLKKVLLGAGVRLIKTNDTSPYRTPSGALLIYMPDPKDDRDFPVKKLLATVVEEAAAVVDYTMEMSPVKNQGRLGSCVAFAASAMKEYQESKEANIESFERTGKPKRKVYDYSEQWIYYKCKSIDPWPNEEGTSIRFAMKVLNKIGTPPEKAWPYNDLNIGRPKKWAKLISLWALIGEYWRISTVPELESALNLFGPVTIGVPVFYEFFYPTNNIIKSPQDPNTLYGGHAILVVGYDRDKQLFKFKNSWGTGWGEAGYGYFTYKFIQNYLWDAWVSKDIRVTRDIMKEHLEDYGI